MKKEEKKHNKNEVIEGFNPRIYRRLSMLFGTLTILNLVVIMYAFAITGYGLWHAEDALSYIAKINTSFDGINQNVLNIELHAEDPDRISNSINRIESYQQDILEYAASFRKIDLNNIDRTIPGDFDIAMEKIELYNDTISPQLDQVRANSVNVALLQSVETEAMREDASSTINALFEKQDESTYIFFCKIGQRFLLVPGFMILTMSAAMYSIRRSKKRDYAYAFNLHSSKQKMKNIKQKAMELSYINVATGLKNRYAFKEKLEERILVEDVTVAVYSFNRFQTINGYYGRDFADEFINAVSQKISAEYNAHAEIFSTETDELCVMFNKDVLKNQAFSMAQRILTLLSQQYQVGGVNLQVNAAGCIAQLKANPKGSRSHTVSLLISMDQCLNQAIAMSMAQNNPLMLQVP